MTDNDEVTYPGNIFIEASKWGSPNPEKAILHGFNTTEELLENCKGWVVDELAELWPKFWVPQIAKGRDLVQLLHRGADLAQTRALFIDRVGEFAHMPGHATDALRHGRNALTGGADQPRAALHLPHGCANEVADLARRLGRAARQRAHLGRPRIGCNNTVSGMHAENLKARG